MDALTEIKNFCNPQNFTPTVGPLIQLKVGVAVGSCYAGLVGAENSRISYEVWGKLMDEVLLMRDTSQPGKIHCTKTVMKLLSNGYSFEKAEKFLQDDDVDTYQCFVHFAYLTRYYLSCVTSSSPSSRPVVPDTLELMVVEHPVDLQQVDKTIFAGDLHTMYMGKFMLHFKSEEMETNYRADNRLYFAHWHRLYPFLLYRILSVYSF